MRLVLEGGAERQRCGAAILQQEIRFLEGELRGGEQRAHSPRRSPRNRRARRSPHCPCGSLPARRARRPSPRRPAREAAHLEVELRMRPALRAVVADDGDRGDVGPQPRVLRKAIAGEVEAGGNGFAEYSPDRACASFCTGALVRQAPPPRLSGTRRRPRDSCCERARVSRTGSTRSPRARCGRSPRRSAGRSG